MGVEVGNREGVGLGGEVVNNLSGIRNCSFTCVLVHVVIGGLLFFLLLLLLFCGYFLEEDVAVDDNDG